MIDRRSPPRTATGGDDAANPDKASPAPAQDSPLPQDDMPNDDPLIRLARLVQEQEQDDQAEASQTDAAPSPPPSPFEPAPDVGPAGLDETLGTASQTDAPPIQPPADAPDSSTGLSDASAEGAALRGVDFSTQIETGLEDDLRMKFQNIGRPPYAARGASEAHGSSPVAPLPEPSPIAPSPVAPSPVDPSFVGAPPISGVARRRPADHPSQTGIGVGPVGSVDPADETLSGTADMDADRPQNLPPYGGTEQINIAATPPPPDGVHSMLRRDEPVIPPPPPEASNFKERLSDFRFRGAAVILLPIIALAGIGYFLLRPPSPPPPPAAVPVVEPVTGPIKEYQDDVREPTFADRSEVFNDVETRLRADIVEPLRSTDTDEAALNAVTADILTTDGDGAAPESQQDAVSAALRPASGQTSPAGNSEAGAGAENQQIAVIVETGTAAPSAPAAPSTAATATVSPETANAADRPQTEAGIAPAEAAIPPPGSGNDAAADTATGTVAGTQTDIAAAGISASGNAPASADAAPVIDPETYMIGNIRLPKPRPARFAVSNNAPAAITDGAQAATPPQEQGQNQSQGQAVYVQLAARRTADLANGAFRQIQARHPEVLGSYQPVIRAITIAERGTFHRVLVALSSLDEARNLCAGLQASGGDCFIRPPGAE